MIQGGSSSGELFTIYVNDLPNQINDRKGIRKKEDSSGEEFVDGISVIAKAENEALLKVKMEKEYDATSQYLINHQMVVNKDKTQIMYIHPDKDQAPPTINIQGCIIEHQKEIKILGMQISENLKMDTHI